AIQGRRYMFEMAEQEKIDFDLEKRGILHVYRSKAEFEHAGRVNAMLNEAGLERRAVTPTEMKQIEPALHGEFYGGYYTPADSTGDIHLFTRGLADACIRRGVRFELDAEVTRIAAGDRQSVTWRNAT